MTQDTHTTATGWALAILAVPVGIFGLGVYMPAAAFAVIMLIVGACLHERRAKCKACGWTWKV